MPKGVLDQKLYTFPPTIVPAGARLRAALQQLLPAMTTRQAIYAITNGMVQIDGKVVRNLDHGVPRDCTITLDLRHGVRGEGKPDRPPLIEQMRVVHDEAAFVVVVKGTGVIVQPSQEEERGRHGAPLVELLKHYWKTRREGIVNPILVQRLDKETSGLMVLGKTIPAARLLQRQAGGREMERKYVAIVEGNVQEESGTWQSWMGTGDDGLRQSVATPEEEPPVDAREAITHFKVLQRAPGATMLELRLGTGRTHQIRIHCAEAGHPVISDFVYVKLARQLFPRVTFGEMPKCGRMMLHAMRLKFRHPGDVNRWMTFEEPAPPAFGDYMKALMEAAREEPVARGPRRPWEDRGPENFGERTPPKFRNDKTAPAFTKKPPGSERPFAKGAPKGKDEGWKPKKSFAATGPREDRKGTGGGSLEKPSGKKAFAKPSGKKPFSKPPAAENEWQERAPQAGGKKPPFGKKPAGKFSTPRRDDRDGGAYPSKNPSAKKPFGKSPRFGKETAEPAARGAKAPAGFSKGSAKKFVPAGKSVRDGGGFAPKGPGAKKPFGKGPRPEKDWSERPPRDDKKASGFSKGPAKKFSAGPPKGTPKKTSGKPSPWDKAARDSGGAKPAFKPRPGGPGPRKSVGGKPTPYKGKSSKPR